MDRLLLQAPLLVYLLWHFDIKSNGFSFTHL